LLYPADRAVQLPALLLIQFHGHAAQTATRSSQDRQRHIQIPLHLGNRRQRRFVGHDALRLQEQLRLGEQARSHRRACLAPGCI
jgi:hypothetical protein